MPTNLYILNEAIYRHIYPYAYMSLAKNPRGGGLRNFLRGEGSKLF
jgi:hypothetical protein